MSHFFDLISDIHLDFWVKVDSNLRKMEKKIDVFVDSLIPSSPSNVLVIAGDLGHYNNQNVIMLRSLMRCYESIVMVRGNHDLYLVSGKQSKKYKWLSENRWREMKDFANQLPGLFVLEGDTIALEGINSEVQECGMTLVMGSLNMAKREKNWIKYGVKRSEIVNSSRNNQTSPKKSSCSTVLSMNLMSSSLM